jgi:hypothetical protein
MPAANSVTRYERVIDPAHIRAVQISAVKPKPGERRVTGPFSRLDTASEPGDMPAEGERHLGKVVVLHGTVKDPYGARRPQKVAFNAHRDALIYDLKQRRIDHDSYAAGVTYRALLEKAHGMNSGQAGEWMQPLGGNKVMGQSKRVIALIQQAHDANEMFARTQPVIGMTGARILELVLIGNGSGGPCTFAEVAQLMGMIERQPNETDASFATRARLEGQYVGRTFRLALKNLASLWQFGDAPKLEEPAWRRR